ncbi:glycosyltransferase family 4 protein [Candidatus Poribacteria bacterium]|nr:glycosyltransferase family 4 protein [Candidatus Poribacteria bacterium]MYK94762.1 glycosyltransferase family 4 protein [Candidatus Poribacteria bacterium]
MVSRQRYQLKRHHKFEQDDRKYVADLETGDLVQVNDVEWEILARYASQTRHRMVERLKGKYKLTAIFEGIERLERLGEQDILLSPIVEPIAPMRANRKQTDRMPKLLVPFHFTQEKSALDYLTGLNRYQFLRHLSAFVELETLAFSEIGEKKEIPDFDEVRVRKVDIPKSSALMAPWYALDGYDGILLLSQFLTEDLFYYRVPDVPVVHCIEGVQQLQHVLPKTLLTLSAFQRSKDTLVVKASWMKEWLAELGVPVENVRVIPDGIDIGAPIGDKVLAKQHTAAIFEKPMFTKQPVVGLISGFEPKRGAAWITAFARANPHLAIFVYDAMLAEHYQHPPENVVIFRADDEETLSVLPIFFQALDLVCFPAMPGTPLSIVLEAMAFGAPCVAMSKYGMPEEVASAGVAVAADWDNFGNFRVPMAELSKTIHKWLKPSQVRGVCENFSERIVQRHTRKGTAGAIVRVFEESFQRETDDFGETERTLFPPIFCRQYEPETGALRSCVYRLGINRDNNDLEEALAEVLAEGHTSAEVASVFKHFQRESPVCM